MPQSRIFNIVNMSFIQENKILTKFLIYSI